MAKVRIKVRPSGAINGQPWPEVGKTIELPDAVAEGMASAGFVEPVKATRGSDKVETRPANTDGEETRKPTARKRAAKKSQD